MFLSTALSSLYAFAVLSRAQTTSSAVSVTTSAEIAFSTAANGNFVFVIPQSLANSMASWLAQVTCTTDPDPAPFRKRAVSGNYPCAVANAKVALQHASLNSPIYNGLLVMPTFFPNLQQDLYAAIVQVVSYARTLSQWSVLLLPSDSLMYSIGGVVLFLALYHEYDPLQGIVSNTIPYSDLASATTLLTSSSNGPVSSTTGTQSCPTRTVTSPIPTSTEIPVCCTISGCNADTTATVCGSGPYSNCPCAPLQTSEPDSLISPQDWDAIQVFLASVQSYSPAKNSTTMTSSTAAAATTTAAAAPPAVTTPVLTCQDYMTYYYDEASLCKWLAVSQANVNASAKQFVDTQLPNHNLSEGLGNITQALGVGGLNYITNVGWIPGCTAITSQSVANPIPSDPTVSVQTVLENAFSNCTNNNGTGGWFDIVCLRVGFWPTIVDMGAPVDLLPWFNNAAYCV